ncbi:MAG: SDR family oxidoreductase [Filimonas sp.]|nr:SDR family oxidoreductase [Filimonas sp.]
MTQAKILLTGATGTVGTQLVKKLVASDTQFKALVRNNDNGDLLKTLPQAEVVIGDLSDPSSIANIFEGIEKAFLLTNSSEQAEQLQLNFVEAAQQAGVKHIVKLSQFAAEENSPVRFLRYHARVEKRIKETGVAYTFLRPNLYMQGLLAFKDYIKAEGKFYASAGTAPISAVDVRDIASVAAKALTEPGHENKTYNITGEEALTHYEMAAILSRVLGREIAFIDVAPEQMGSALRAAGFPEWQVGGLIEDYAHYARGEAAEVYDTVCGVTAESARSFEQFVEDYSVLFNK